MNFDYVPLFVAWGILALVVLGLFIWRKAVASNEDDTLHVMHGALTQQTAIAQKLDMIDKWGKILTIITRSSSAGLPWESDDDEPGIILFGPKARFRSLRSFCGRCRRESSRGRRGSAGVHLVPPAGGEARQERARRAHLRYLPRIARQGAAPGQHSQTGVPHLPCRSGGRLR